MTKKCRKCLQILEERFFSPTPKLKDGLASYCRECSNSYRRIKRKDPEYRKKESEKAIIYRKTPEGAKKRKRFYKKNKKRIIEVINKRLKERDAGLYHIYWSIRARCKYPSQTGYKYYGGKGIKVEWESYEDFKNDMYKSYTNHINVYGKKQTTIDRLDNNKNYCKENCRWATWKEQSNNRNCCKKC